jgi:hypothetical protein
MRVRELIRALAKHDLDMEVVMPADPDMAAEYMVVAGVEENTFAPGSGSRARLKLAAPHDEGAIVAVRLRSRPNVAAH